MARILFTWELGGGMGHVAPHLPLAKGLREKGHEVAFALRDLRFAETSLGQHDFPYYQAPVIHKTPDDRIRVAATFAQILHNVGYGDVDGLTALAKAWKKLFDCYQPDLLICDHSPTALLASRAIQCKKIVIGPGFFIPPDVSPLPINQNITKPKTEDIQSDEARILSNINHVLERIGSQPVERITQLYEADEKILTTFSELDHYREIRQKEKGVLYWGIGLSGLGSEPVWPDAPGKRIYAYLKPFKTLPALLDMLRQLKMPVIIYAPELGEDIKQAFACPTIHFSKTPLNLDETAASCDIAITNATHATAATFLLAGKPLMMLPIFLEQSMVAYNVEKIGAGKGSILATPREMKTNLDALLQDSCYQQDAEAFAKKYIRFDAETTQQRLIDHVDNMLKEHNK